MSAQKALFQVDGPLDGWIGPDDFKECVHLWAERIGVKPRRIQMREATKKWGSCSSNGVLTFSNDLLKQPRKIGEIVIVHELVHLKVPNHGPVFRSLAEAYLPGASDLRIIGFDNGVSI